MAGCVEAAAARPSQHSGSNKNVACASCRLFHLDQAYEVEAVLSDVVAVSSAELQKIVLRHDAELLRLSERRLHGRNVDGTNSNRGEPAEGLQEDQDQDHRPALLLGWSAAVAELRGQKQNQSSVEHVAAQAGEVHLRCVCLDKQDLLAPGGLDPYWPYMGSLNYDNAPVAEIKPPQPGHPRKEEPFLNITQRVRKILLSRAEEAGDHEHHDTSRSATSEIAFSFSASFFAARGRMDEDWPDPPTEFALQAFFVRKLSPDHLKAKAFSIMRSKIHNENRVWKHFSRFDVVRQQHKNTGDHGVEAEGENDHLDQSDDDELQLVREDVEERTVSLNCPIGGILPIKIPVYGEHCEHLQSVDLENFLDLLPQTRNPAKKWRCAICHRAMRLWDLRFCSFTYEIIEGVRMKNQGRGAGRGGGDEDPDEEEDPLLSDSFVLEEDEARVLVNADGSYSFDFEKELQKEREEKFGRAMNLDEDGDSAAKRLKKDEAEQEVQKIARVNEIASVNVHNDNKCDCDAPVDEVGRRGALHGTLSDRMDDGELHSDSCQLIELEDSSDEG